MMTTTLMMVFILGGRNQRRHETKEILRASGSTLLPPLREKVSTSRSLGPPMRQVGVSCSSVTWARTGRGVCRGRCLRFPSARSGTLPLPVEVVVGFSLVVVGRGEAALENVFRLSLCKRSKKGYQHWLQKAEREKGKQRGGKRERARSFLPPLSEQPLRGVSF